MRRAVAAFTLLSLVSACQEPKREDVKASPAAAEPSGTREAAVAARAEAGGGPAAPGNEPTTASDAPEPPDTAPGSTAVAPRKPSALGPAAIVAPVQPSVPAVAPVVPGSARTVVPVKEPPTPRRRPPGPPPKLKVTDRDPIHDRSSPAFALLQRPSRALRGFPLDRRGRVDWVRALAEGRIRPRSSVLGHKPMSTLESEIVMRNTRSMPYVRFPHAEHTQWLSCSNCHPRPFPKRAGGVRMTMDEIFRGKYCGVCHDKVAFSTFVCERCHSIPHDGSPAPWW